MVVLRVLLDRDAFWSGMEIRPLSEACREHLVGHWQLQSDLRPTDDISDHRLASPEQRAAWWLKWPLSRWFDEQQGDNGSVGRAKRFVSVICCPEETRVVFENMTGRSCRLSAFSVCPIQKASV
jgi:hypothetical protein